MTEHRAELLDRCVQKLLEETPEHTKEKLTRELESFVDEVVGALRRDAGVGGSSPLPESSRTAANLSLTAAQIGVDAAPQIKPVGVTPLLRELVAAAVPERGIRIDVEAADGLTAHADERLLTSAVGNLLQNAIKFTKDGGRI